MTRKQLFAGTVGLGLMLSTYAGCYIQKETISVDGDFDGFGEGADCNDDDSSVFPGALEVCGDGIDNDCDGKIDDLDPECGGVGGSDGTGGSGGSGSGGSGSGGSGSGGSGTGGSGTGGSGTGGSGTGGSGTGGSGTGGSGTGGSGGGITPPPDV